MNICIYGAASSVIDKMYIETVEKLGETLAKRGHNLVFGAGDSGLMGAAARGFHKGGGKVTGVVPAFFRAGTVEKLYEDCDNLVYTGDMGVRKHIMEENSDAFIITPGGIGTFDEFFQVLTLKDLRLHSKPIAVFNINGYYYGIQALMHAGSEGGFLRSKCLSLFEVFDESEVDEMIKYVEAGPEVVGKLENDYKNSGKD